MFNTLITSIISISLLFSTTATGEITENSEKYTNHQVGVPVTNTMSDETNLNLKNNDVNTNTTISSKSITDKNTNKTDKKFTSKSNSTSTTNTPGFVQKIYSVQVFLNLFSLYDILQEEAVENSDYIENSSKKSNITDEDKDHDATSINTPKSDEYYADLLDNMDFSVSVDIDTDSYENDSKSPNSSSNSPDLSVESDSDSYPTTSDINHCKMLVYKTLNALPEDHYKELDDLVLTYTNDGRRGYGGAHKVILRCSDVEDSELTGVLVHEIGHVVDIGLYKGSPRTGKSNYYDGQIPIYRDDLSLDFYNINWIDSENQKESSDKLDFVTGYSKTDAFEDFAESYAFYIFQGDTFREMTEYNDKLSQKYDFLKENVFDGEEFDFSDPDDDLVFDRDYDSTVLPYDQEGFFETDL